MTHQRLPARGCSWSQVQAQMAEARKDDLPWYGPRYFKPTYFMGDDIVEVADKAYQMYISHNLLYGTSSFPSLGRYETEVVGMLLDILNAPAGAGGNLTTGGTESNIMAVKTARDWAREHRPDAPNPQIIAPHTVHMSFDKASQLLGVKLVTLDHSLDYRADVKAISAAINPNTIMLVGSAPPYAYGTVDPISEIATLAARHGLWMHVDCCLGGFILPFARKLGYAIPDFDFEVPGVTSMSIDIHKYGYSAKGISALLLCQAEFEKFRRFSVDGLTGLYSTPNIAGSRSGGAVSSAWAVMRYLGEEGYLKSVKRILEIRDRFIDGIQAIDELEVQGRPHAYQFGFGSDTLDIFAVADGMADRGWVSGRGVEPPAILLMINASHETSVQAYLGDLATVARDVKAGRVTRRSTQQVRAN